MSKTIVTVRYESDAPYTDGEKLTLVEAISEVVTDIDGDADGTSFTIAAQTEAEEADAKAMAVVEFLNKAEITSTLSIVPEAGGAPITVEFAETVED